MQSFMLFKKKLSKLSKLKNDQLTVDHKAERIITLFINLFY